ncbi:MAG TPA: bifunctional (p)ppGpp synthetase/guanosine-3',5'-bis(diphosphate) 3'-pyrophosphohydrolase [Terriglobales bacterium]|nr:bifunctional (p)ppGpp synthetase/guanosine-3',5'-bis(diphosphate) 3'-pyrophosphohydrolase [Terriglobales bacterium]
MTPAAQFEALASRVREIRPGDDHDLLRRAFEFSARLHAPQRRRSGEAYIAHPLAVASVLAELEMDTVCIAAGLLHDAVEDTPATTEQISREFGPVVAHLVEGVTKIDRLEFQGPSQSDARQAESVRKMLLAMVDDIRVILIRLADRLHNMRTLAHMPPDRQQVIARETMDIYAPLAHRLGMGKMRGELEDLAFSYLEPEAYCELQAAVDSRRAGGEEFLAGVERRVLHTLREHEIPARVEGRIKRIYSIWQKLQRQHIEVDQVYDLLALRIITDSIRDCYAVLGVIHSAWRPVPGRIKDFIATPRANMYRSLHTSVIDASGQPFEIQIRTEEMHRMAEEGIAAHWKYKAGAKPAASASEDQRILWLRRLVEWQRDIADPGEFLSLLKVDLAPEEIYAFTPKGLILALARDACPIDFAYAIHTEIGHRTIGARVNGKIVPLRYHIQTGDIVEILTQPGHVPNRDWLSFVRTPRARQKIRHWLNIHERVRATEIGRRALERDARRFEVPLKDLTDAALARAGEEYGLARAEDVYAAVGYGKVSARQVLLALVPPPARSPEQARLMRSTRRTPRPAAGSPILVRGFSDLLVYRAACCNPIHGEQIVGYITRGKGVAVHGVSCPNVRNLLYEPDRRIDVAWAPVASEVSEVKLTIRADDNAGILNAVTAVISERSTNIRTVGAKAADGEAQIDLAVEVATTQALDQIMRGLQRVAGVRSVQRVSGV